MNTTILLPSMGKIVRQTGLFNFGMTTGLQENSEFKPVKLRLKLTVASSSWDIYIYNYIYIYIYIYIYAMTRW